MDDYMQTSYHIESNSLLNKDYVTNDVKSYSLIGGIPAKLLAINVRRIYDPDNESFLIDYFFNCKEKTVPSTILPIQE